MIAYYNEFDPHAAAWLEQLIADGEIAYGYVDRRSICDVSASELAGFTQCHFFAGIGGWSRALRLAGVSDDTPIWTGSCPCQPFSSAGKGDGFDDLRHLWPHFFRLISALRPARVVGEQVASPDALIWWDAVCADLEGAGYAGWAADLCSAGIGAPHIRQRLYWVADASGAGSPQQRRGRQQSEGSAPHGIPVGLADAHQVRREPLSSAGQPGEERDAEPRGGVCGVADADKLARQQGGSVNGERDHGCDAPAWPGSGGGVVPGWPGPSHGIRRDADWLHCRDGKWRPVKPGLVPLVNGLPRGVVPSRYVGLEIDADNSAEARAVRLKGYGNAIDPELAAMFLLAVS